MTRTTKTLALATVAALTLGAAVIILAQAAPAPAPAATGRQGLTVYMDISVVGRKHGAAEKMTKMHAEKAAQGYTLIGVAPYTENGDLQGFYVSYVKE